MFTPKDFELYEVLPKEIYDKFYPFYGDKLWIMFPPQTLWTLQKLRDRYGRIEINTWHNKGPHNYRGWRPLDCRVGAKLSLHKFGLAMDNRFLDTRTDQVREDIIADKYPEDFRYITAVELDTVHLHWDCRNHDKQRDGLLKFRVPI